MYNIFSFGYRETLTMIPQRANVLAREMDLYEGSILGQLFQVESILGEGGFGVVSKCCNIQTGQKVAIKVNKNHPSILYQAKKEISILKQLCSLDPERSSIVQWNGFFYNKKSICLTFELLDISLQRYIQGRQGRSVPVTEVRSVVHQLTTALSHLKDRGIVHGDLKPGNVMIVDRHSSPLRVKLIDFGLARHVSECKAGDLLQTVCYRAPEILLGAPYNEAADVWTLGLVAAEMVTGCFLYGGHTEYDVLSYIVATQGQPPDSVLNQGKYSRYYFYYNNGSRKPWKFKIPREFHFCTGRKPLDTRDIRLRSLNDLCGILEKNFGHSREHYELVDLIKRMLHLDKDQRITLQEIMDHPFMAPCLGMTGMEKEEVAVDLQLLSQTQTSGHQDLHCISQIEDDSETAASKTQESGEDVQPQNREENTGHQNLHCISQIEDDSETAASKTQESGEDVQPQNSEEKNTGHQNLHCIIQMEDDSETAASKMQESGEDVQPQNREENIGMFRGICRGVKRSVLNSIRRAFACLPIQISFI